DPVALAARTIAHVCGELGTRIWPALMEQLPVGTQKLILIPSAGLNVLPLHAARLADGTRICERWSVVYAPSLGLLQHSQGQSALPLAPRLGQVANPTGDLLFSGLEVRTVAKRMDRSKAQSVSGPATSVERIMTLLKETDIFHYSGHAFFDAHESFRSGLLLAAQIGENAVLTLGTILDTITSIRSKFVLLSACETGQVEPGDILDDFLGLPGGFVVAGAGAVLATLWRVDDLASCLLLDKFFELWRANCRDAPQALAAAQQWLRTKVTVDQVIEKLEAWLEDPADNNK